MISFIAWPSLIHMDLITSKFTCFLSLFFVFLFFNCAKADINGDANALLEFKRNVTNTRNLVSWNSSNITSSICTSWEGVTCSTGSGSSQRVSELHLPGSALYGAIPSQTLGNLDALEVLSLRENKLSVNLPADLANCVKLRQLILQNNSFSGPLPANFSVWPLMQRIDLSSNNFSGDIPASLSNLTHLKSLFLDNNNLSGSIPSALTVASTGNFSVANNNLSGPIPSSLSRFPAESFAGNTGLCGTPLGECGQSSSSSKLRAGAIVGIVIGAVAAFAAVWLLALLLRRKRKKEGGAAGELPDQVEAEKPANTNTAAGSNGSGTAEPRLTFVGGNAKETFDFDDLLRASAEVLGKGSVGTAYKTIMENGLMLRVKRILSLASEREDHSKRVVQHLGALHHPNLVPLRAYFLAPKDTLLVSDYMPNGDLSSLLHHGIGRGIMDWEECLAIAEAVARGLLYLHSEKVVHGSIKSSNVLLDGDGHARLTDYGLLQLAALQPGSNLKATNGYTPPEASSDLRKITSEGDVYAFGVLLLELLTRKSPIALAHEGISLPQWIQSRARLEEALDPHLMNYDYIIQEEMIRLFHIALPCVSLPPHQRPSMEKVVNMIESLRNQEDSETFPSNAEISSLPISSL